MAGLGREERNPFRSVIVRAVEILQAVEEALAIVEAYQPPTSQNQAAIEADLRRIVQAGAHLEDGQLTTRCEEAIATTTPASPAPRISWIYTGVDLDITRR